MQTSALSSVCVWCVCVCVSVGVCLVCVCVCVLCVCVYVCVCVCVCVCFGPPTPLFPVLFCVTHNACELTVLNCVCWCIYLKDGCQKLFLTTLKSTVRYRTPCFDMRAGECWWSGV